MRSQKPSSGLVLVLALLAVTTLTGTNAAAQTETVLHNFNPGGVNAAYPLSSLIFDAAGSLYGTTSGGGSGTQCGTIGCGTVFELSPKAGGGWTGKVLHNFNSNGKDGNAVYAPLIMDAGGNLYGTTAAGGSRRGGTVFELLPKAGGGWTERILHNFNDDTITDGAFPYCSLVLDGAGNLYGTTSEGGANGAGIVFELTPSANSWTETVLHTFTNNFTDGSYPYGGLIFDASGNLYGTTYSGGILGYGTVFELSPAAGGGWTETVLHNFSPSSSDGQFLYGVLLRDKAGNLYGTTQGGGANSGGTVFELTPASGGLWTESLLHSFGLGSDGKGPSAVTLIMDASGNLYGTTEFGGSYNYGIVFELTPAAGGSWTEKALHSFGLSKDGRYPTVGLISDSAGNLYGTTQAGGADGGGTVFEIAH
jgi:uncharacterized repeat protein (TIGR03803 family)